MMKNWKKLAVTGAVLAAIAATSVTALAANGYGSPAEIVAGLTGRSVESVAAEHAQSGNTYGAIAQQAGSLEAFKAQMLELKKEALAARVAAGTMTQERADAILAAMEENQATCDGTCTGGTCEGLGGSFGSQNRGQNANQDGSQTGSQYGGQRGGRAGSGLGMGTCITSAE